MKRLLLLHSCLAASFVCFSIAGCTAEILLGEENSPDVRDLETETSAPEPTYRTKSIADRKASPPTAPAIANVTENQIEIEPLPVDPQLQNPWTEELEREFWQRANQAIAFHQGKKYGNTWGENEKGSYPKAMFDFLAGNRDRAIAFLQSQDAQAEDNAHTQGIDYYFAFTLKGQIRKYFFFGSFLDPEYRQTMFDGARTWTEEDPHERPHPKYGRGFGNNGWGPDTRGGWVDVRTTDNLQAMRETSVYLMAEETGNEDVRQLYKKKLKDYVSGLYYVGMSEWDSENYHCHTIVPYLNLYDFAKDPEVKQIAKAGLDWLSAAGAVKYYRGGFGGPTKRDYGKSNVVYGSASARCLWLWFGDGAIANPQPEQDLIHPISSAYRPPQAVVALARKQFPRPVELLATKPMYSHWGKRGGQMKPEYWETTFFGETYQMGSVVSESEDGDVGPFKLMVDNSDRGVDYFVANTGGDRVKPGKHEGDQIGQYRNLLIWLRRADDRPFFFQIPKTAKAEVEEGIWFFQFQKTWIAVFPIHLNAYTSVTMPTDKEAELYRNEVTLKATKSDNFYTGFALEVGEENSHGSYANFKQAVKTRSQLNFNDLANGTVQLTGSNGNTLQVTHNPKKDLPIVLRNDIPYQWLENFELYTNTEENSPISLGWKQGTLRVEAGGTVFESTAPGMVK